ncbi:unnamed protein product [Chrysoparadoxa australica]
MSKATLNEKALAILGITGDAGGRKSSRSRDSLKRGDKKVNSSNQAEVARKVSLGDLNRKSSESDVARVGEAGSRRSHRAGASESSQSSGHQYTGSGTSAAREPEVEDDDDDLLIIGEGVEISAVEADGCNRLVLSGDYNGAYHGKMLLIEQAGCLEGVTQCDLADIYGKAAGELTVSHKLSVYTGGEAFGKIRYGQLIMQPDAKLDGDLKQLRQ